MASFPVVLSDFGCDVTCQACPEIELCSKLPLVTRIARTGLGTRLKDRVWDLNEEGVLTAFTA